MLNTLPHTELKKSINTVCYKTKSSHLQGKQRANTGTNLSIDALSGHALSADTVAGAVHPRSLHPAAAQGKLFQPLRVSCITSICKSGGAGFDL